MSFLLLFFRRLFGLYTYRSTNLNVMRVSFSTLSWIRQTLVFCSTFTQRRKNHIINFLPFSEPKEFPSNHCPIFQLLSSCPQEIKCFQNIWTALVCLLCRWQEYPHYCAATFFCLMTNRSASGINPTHQHQTLLGWPSGQLFHCDSNLCTDLHITEAKLSVRGYIKIQYSWTGKAQRSENGKMNCLITSICPAADV